MFKIGNPGFTLLLFLLIFSCQNQSHVTKPSTKNTANQQSVFIFVHGAWGGGWEYTKVDSILTSKGHTVYRPTLTGLGERVHLSNKEVNLTTHINDIINLISYERLDNVILCGHSYSGMVITGVAEEIPEKIKQLIYLDAFLPEDGESLKSIIGDSIWDRTLGTTIKNDLVPYVFGTPKPFPPNDVPQPAGTFTEPLKIKNPQAREIPTTYVLMTADGKGDFETAAQRARKKSWQVVEMEGDHYPMRNQPESLVKKIEEILTQ